LITGVYISYPEAGSPGEISGAAAIYRQQSRPLFGMCRKVLHKDYIDE